MRLKHLKGENMSINHQTIIKSTPLQVIQTITNPEFIKHVSTQLGGEIEKFEIEGNIAEQFTTNTITKTTNKQTTRNSTKNIRQTIHLTQNRRMGIPPKSKIQNKNLRSPHISKRNHKPKNHNR